MPESERRQAIQKFNSSTDIKVFVLHAGQAGAGLTLTIARTLILLEPFASPGDEAQAMNRCHRIGQTRSVQPTHVSYRSCNTQDAQPSLDSL